MNVMSRAPAPDENVFNSFASTLSQAAGNIGRTLGRTAASAGELLSDAELRRKGTILLVHEASRGIKEIQQKVGNAAGNLGRTLQNGAGTIQRGIFSGPRQIQTAMERVRSRVQEVKLANRLEIHRNLPVDVQLAERLFEDAPQEIRTRFWAVLTLVLHDGESLIVPDKAEESESDLIDLRDNIEESKDEWELIENPSIHLTPATDLEDLQCLMNFESLMEKMSTLSLPLDEEISPESNYGTLIQITVGQDEVDDVIRRDIHRTFPELPHFNYQDKCSALFNILKAYSLHDLEVGYCQGMGFVAGILLIYLPEIWAFKMLCLLMEEKRINLRQFYLPGLAALKRELWKLEWLLERHFCILWKHFLENGVSAVLYGSQWFLTGFACPFNEAFAARVLDLLLVRQSTIPMIQVAFAVLIELGEELLQQNNFEDILIQMKVKPLSWDIVTIRRVLNASLESPITLEDVMLAESAYEAIESESQVERREGEGLDSNQEVDFLQFDDPHTEHEMVEEMKSDDLTLMLSMDLLLDVDHGTSQTATTVTTNEEMNQLQL